mmetsp:Transcript_33753/g.106651  ORF Transcript_33753/g.106651 Transcript_33753/m.106651 type:complete len:200 (-) Transcript_33753:751-1350(-)
MESFRAGTEWQGQGLCKLSHIITSDPSVLDSEEWLATFAGKLLERLFRDCLYRGAPRGCLHPEVIGIAHDSEEVMFLDDDDSGEQEVVTPGERWERQRTNLWSAGLLMVSLLESDAYQHWLTRMRELQEISRSRDADADDIESYVKDSYHCIVRETWTRLQAQGRSKQLIDFVVKCLCCPFFGTFSMEKAFQHPFLNSL